MSDTIETLRDFTRSWSRLSGLFVRHPYGVGLGLAEARLLYDIGHPEAGQPPPSAAELARMLAMDTGQVSRLLRGLAQRGLIERGSATGRRRPLRVTAAGQEALAALETASRQSAAALLAGLPSTAQEDLAASLGRARALLAPGPAATVLRPPRPGELGWIMTRHATLYGQEQGWDALAFEAHVARIIADYGAAPAPARQALWIAALGGAPAGSVAVVDAGAGTARLRLLILDPVARGRGLGRALLAEALGFARAQGYARMTLSTYASLLAARRLYTAEGFGLRQSTPVQHWGQALVAEEWDRAL